MATLEELQDVAKPTLEDLGDESFIQPKSVSKSSNLNLSAYASTFIEDPSLVEPTFRMMSGELDEAGESLTADQILGKVKDQTLARNKEVLVDFLTDPSVSDQDKIMASQGIYDQQKEMYNFNNLVSREALIEGVPGESVEAEKARVSLVDVIEEVNESKRYMQAALNREVAKLDASTINGFTDIFEYFVPFVESKNVGDVADAMRDGEGWAYDEAFTLLGNLKVDVRDVVQGASPEQQMELTDKLVGIVKNNSNITLVNDNDFAKFQMLDTVLREGSISDIERWVDNITSILDLTIVGGAISKGAKRLVGYGLSDVAEVAVRNARRMAVKSRVQPASLSQNLKDTNPAKAKAVHDAVVADLTDEAAEIYYGSSKADAMVNDLGPEVASPNGSVKDKVAGFDSKPIGNQKVVDYLEDSGAIHYSKEEKVRASGSFVNEFQQAIGGSLRKEMTQIDELGNGVKISLVYGPRQGGFATPQRALEMTEWNLREFGVDPNNIKLMRKEGDTYVESSIKEIEALEEIKLVADKTSQFVDKKGQPISLAKAQPDFLVKVDHKYEVSPLDVGAMAELPVSNNFFDRLGLMTGKNGAGSLQQHWMDAASMLDKRLTGSASVASEKVGGLEKMLLDLGKEFTDLSSKLPVEQQGLLNKYVREANDLGIDIPISRMATEGFSKEGLRALSSWKETWDTMWRLENRDLTKSLKAQGYMRFKGENEIANFIAKPIKRKQDLGKVIRAYDSAQDKVRTISASEIDEIYGQGGVVAKLKSGWDRGDESVEFVLSREAPGKSYLKGLSEAEPVLDYRKGYYTVYYKEPHFVRRRSASGKETTVANVKNLKEAELIAARNMEGAEEGVEYWVSRDKKELTVGSDEYWDLQSARGRVAQRYRGARLEDSTSNIDDPTKSNILDPIDSLVHSIRSISNRAPMREWFDASKERFTQQFADYAPKDQFNRTMFPNDITEVAYRGDRTLDANKLGDARTTYNYIRSMEDGYINAMDDGYKRIIRSAADAAGKRGMRRTEDVLNWFDKARGPSSSAKALVFNSLIATNPVRQAIIQSHQMMQLTAINPTWMVKNASFSLPAHLMKQAGVTPPKQWIKMAGYKNVEEFNKVHDQFMSTGLVASIDKQNLVRGSLSEMTDHSHRGFEAANKAIAGLRKVGFDFGENVNRTSSWLAIRDLRKSKGLDVDSRHGIDETTAEATNFTYNMNQAGELPYNRNSLAMFFQFLQVPHKSLLTMTTNKGLTWQEKSRLIAFNTAMYGVPAGLIAKTIGEENLPKDPDARHAVVNGLESAFLNKMLTEASGEQQNVSFKSLSPLDLYGTAELVTSILTLDFGEMIANAPATQLFFGHNPRVTDWARSVAKMTHHTVFEEEKDPEVYLDTVTSFLRISSGFSNTFNALVVQDTHKKISNSNRVSDSMVTKVEQLATIAGFETIDSANTRTIKRDLYLKSKEFEGDVKTWFSQLNREFLRKGVTPMELDYMVRVLNKATVVWGNDPKAFSIIQKEMLKSMDNGDTRLIEKIMQSGGFLGEADREAMIMSLPNTSDKAKQQLLEVSRFMTPGVE